MLARWFTLSPAFTRHSGFASICFWQIQYHDRRWNHEPVCALSYIDYGSLRPSRTSNGSGGCYHDAEGQGRGVQEVSGGAWCQVLPLHPRDSAATARRATVLKVLAKAVFNSNIDPLATTLS